MILLKIVLIAFGETLWIQSVQYEVFTMNNMFICVILFLTVRFYYAYWNEDYKNCTTFLHPLRVVYSIALIGAFVGGLSLCNQHTIIFYLLPIILSILGILFKTSQLTTKRFLQLASLFLLGLLPYLYLVIASFFPKIGNWGDMRTWKGKEFIFCETQVL